jgi:DNA end-binding protein Ku
MRPIWSGHISFGLISIPISIYAAVEASERVSFRLLHRKDHAPIMYKKFCSREDVEVPNDEIAKAYEVSDGELVYLTDDDFAAAQEESYKAVEILDFVPYSEIDPIVFQRTYYLGPAEGAEKVYALLVKAMESSDLAAVARYVFHDKQQLGLLRVRDRVITLENMYFADEIRPTEDIVPSRLPRVDEQELEMAKSLIDRFTSSFDHEKYEDEYRARLLEVVKRKQRGDEVHAPPEPDREAPSDLLDALRASVEAAKATGRTRSRKTASAKPRRRRSKSKA